VIYVNAGATGPLPGWLDALRPGGRLLFPMTPAEGAGAMLLLARQSEDRFEARFVCRAMFIACAGARDETVAKDLSGAFQCKDLKAVRSLRRRSPPNDTCWFAGPDWWLSSEGA
jgi:protein-L-isoaspartate(D-aspartate) O-methyltransferase